MVKLSTKDQKGIPSCSAAAISTCVEFVTGLETDDIQLYEDARSLRGRERLIRTTDSIRAAKTYGLVSCSKRIWIKEARLVRILNKIKSYPCVVVVKDSIFGLTGNKHVVSVLGVIGSKYIVRNSWGEDFNYLIPKDEFASFFIEAYELKIK